LDYEQVLGLSNEVRDKLITQKPETLGRASRIPGVTPAAISLLLVHMKRRQGRNTDAAEIDFSVTEPRKTRQQTH